MNAWHRVGVLFLAATLGACSVQVGGQDEGDGADPAAQADSTAADSLSKPIEAIPVEVALAHTAKFPPICSSTQQSKPRRPSRFIPKSAASSNSSALRKATALKWATPSSASKTKQLRIAVEEAQANYQYQQTAFKRTEAMFERNLISDQEFETNKYNFEQARLRLERARLELEYAEVIAPFSGVITERHVQVGARVGPSSKLYDLIKLDDLIAAYLRPANTSPPSATASRPSSLRSFCPTSSSKPGSSASAL